MPNNFEQNKGADAAADRRENLAESFRLWEQAGRGWQVFNEITELEPAFSRFMPPSRINHPLDDGKIPGLWGRLFSNKPAASQLADGEESSAHNLVNNVPSTAISLKLASFRLYLPSELKISFEQTEQILQTLAAIVSLASFEIIGSNKEIVFQIICPETEKTAVFAQLKNYLPTVAAKEEEDALYQNFSPDRRNETIAVDFGFGREWFIPLLSGKNLATDPLIPLIAVMEALMKGEAACLQVLFCRTSGNWQPAAQEAIFDRTGKPVFANLNYSLVGIKEKLSQPLLAVGVRLMAQSDSNEKSRQIVRRTKAFFGQFSAPSGNELIPLRNDDLTGEKHFQSFFDRTSYRSGMLLSSRELSALVHLPFDSVRSPKIKRDENLTKLMPDLATTGNLILGENHHSGIVRKVYLSSAQRIKHAHYIGASGSGKSTLLTHNMMQDLTLGNGFACFDPHGDLIDAVLERVPESRLKDVILFDPADENYPIGFNILSAHSELEKTLLASDLVSIFRRFSTSWGDQMNSVLANAILVFLENTRGGTLLDLKRFLVEKDFRAQFLQTVTDEEVCYYWQKEFPELKGKPYASLLTRLDTFLRSKLIRHIVAQKQNKLDFRQMMDERKILLVRLSLGAIGEENAYLLGSLLVAKLYHATLSRQNVAEEARPPFFLYLDEAHHFVTESMNQILSGVRKYKLGLVLAHQQLRQFQSGEADILASVLANCYTRICFRLDDADAERLAKGFSFFTADHLKNLGVGEAIARFEQSQYDFNLKTFPLEKVPAEIAAQRRNAIIDQTRKNYAKPKAEVEAELKNERNVISESSHPNQKSKPKVMEPLSTVTSTISQTEAPTVKEPSLTPIIEPIIPVSTGLPPNQPNHPDKGTTQHRYLQSLIKRIAESKGFLATLEKEVLGGIGKIDVALEREALKIACEISVTNDATYEFQNIQKCLVTGYSPVVVISADKRHLEKIRQMAAKNLSSEDFIKVKFFIPEEFYAWFENLEDDAAQREEKVKGFRVKVKLKLIDEADRTTRQKAISEIVFGGLKNVKKSSREE